MIDEYVFDDGGMNLLSSRALRDLRAAIASITGRVFVFKSGRPHIFAAGADMAEMQRFTPREAEEFARLGQEVFAEIERLPCVTVAIIDGDCFGGALDLVLAFDIRFATPRSRFAHPGARLGIVTGFGGTSRWRKVISRPAANQLFLANRVFSAEEALKVGLVDRVAEAGVILTLSEAKGKDLDQRDPSLTLRVTCLKELILHSEHLSRSELLTAARRVRA